MNTSSKPLLSLLDSFKVLFHSCEIEEITPSYAMTTSVFPKERGSLNVSPNFQYVNVVKLTLQSSEGWVIDRWEGDRSGRTTIHFQAL